MAVGSVSDHRASGRAAAEYFGRNRQHAGRQSEGEPTHLRSANMEPVIAGGAMNPSGINANESVVRPSRMSTRLTQLQGYGLAVLSVGAAVGASLLLAHFGFRSPTAQLMLFAVAIISWYGERGPSLFSLILAVLSMAYFFAEPRYDIRVASFELPYFITFASLATLIFSFSTVRRRLEQFRFQSH